MNNRVIVSLAVAAFLSFSNPSWGIDESSIEPSQKEYEHDIHAVVRNKLFYKKGKLELGFLVGLMPYDSLVNHYMAGGRLQWHISDHWGWEIVDLQLMFPSVRSFTTQFASRNGGPTGIQNLEVLQNKWAASTGLFVSPFYGKMRLFGRSTVHFDFYLAMGAGAASVENHLVNNTTVSLQTTKTSPMLNLGLGFKFFMADYFSLLIDLRDYVTYTQIYGGDRFQSNFTVQAGLSIFFG